MDRFDWWVFWSLICFATFTGGIYRWAPAYMNGWTATIYWVVWITGSLALEYRTIMRNP